MEVEQSPININISRQIEQDEKYNQFKEYLIINHLDLQRENNILKDRIADLTSEINEKESEEDKYDSRTRYFRSLLTNLNELKNGYKETSKNRNNLVNQTNNNWYVLYKAHKKFNIQIMILNIVFILVQFLFQYYKQSPIKLSIYLIINTTFIYGYVDRYIKIIKYVKTHRNESKLLIDKILKETKEKETELVKLDESTLSLENWIYEV